jgi:small conductance mechanosensitive channel
MTKETTHYLILVFATLAAATILSIVFRRLFSFLIKKNAEHLGINPTTFSFLKNSVTFFLYIIAIIWVFYKIPYFNSLGSALFASAGILAAIIGFASQKAFANIIGGLFIVMFKPFRVGDTIEISNNRKGVVEEITLRHTVIMDYEFRRVIIPNSIISDETIINSSVTDEKIRKHIEIGIAYDADVDLAIQIIREEIERHPLFMDERTKQEKMTNEPPVLVRLISLGDFAVTLKAYVWAANNDEAFILQCDVLYSVKKRFDELGVEIPFPYRTIVYKEDLKRQAKEQQKNQLSS